MARLYVSAIHPTSRRTVTVDEADACTWLYLSKAGSKEIEKDVWLYNTFPAPKWWNVKWKRKMPPPALGGYIFGDGTFGSPKEVNVKFRWSDDGEAVAVWFWLELHAFILPESRRGYCRLIKKEGPWGHPMDFEAYDKHLKS